MIRYSRRDRLSARAVGAQGGEELSHLGRRQRSGEPCFRQIFSSRGVSGRMPDNSVSWTYKAPGFRGVHWRTSPLDAIQ